MNEIECTDYKPLNKGAVAGFATIFVPKWGVYIYNITVFSKDGKKWVSFPSREGVGPSNEKKYFPYLRFKESSHFDAFSEKVKSAINKFLESKPKEKDTFDF